MAVETSNDASAESYNATAKILHWLIAAMVVLQFVLANLAEGAEDTGSKFQQLVLLANHKSVGISVSWFNLFQLPDLVAANEGLEEFFEEAHEIFATLLFVLALIHVGAALKHTFIHHDGTIRRISSTLTISLFVAVLVLGVFALTKIGRASETPLDRSSPSVPANPDSKASRLPQRQIDYTNSYIRFIAEQAGADFESEWKNWQAVIRFDAANLDASSFDVAISANSVETMDKERNETLMDSEWFDGANFPQIFYRTKMFSSLPNGNFSANGEMQVKEVVAPVKLIFGVRQDGNRIVLQGQATLDRIALGVGTGDWEDTTWVGQFVEVEVRVEATLP